MLYSTHEATLWKLSFLWLNEFPVAESNFLDILKYSVIAAFWNWELKYKWFLSSEIKEKVQQKENWTIKKKKQINLKKRLNDAAGLSLVSYFLK